MTRGSKKLEDGPKDTSKGKPRNRVRETMDRAVTVHDEEPPSVSAPASSYPSHELDRFIVRLPNGMRDDLRSEAEKNGRSMNAELVHRLQLTFQFDLDVGEMERIRSEAGPIADIIRDEVGKVLLDLSDLRAELGLDPLGSGPSEKSERVKVRDR